MKRFFDYAQTVRPIRNMLILAALGASLPALAELDPELAQTQTKNENGLALGLNLHLGQANATGGSTPGIGLLVGVEPVYVARRDSWGRLEGSLELGTGLMGFREKSSPSTKVNLNIPVYTLAKFGYGWSIGESAFNIVRIGAGPFLANYEGKAGSVNIKSSDTAVGLGWHLAYNILFPAGELFDVIAGAEYTRLSFDFDAIEVDGVKVDENESFDVNYFSVTIGPRLTF